MQTTPYLERAQVGTGEPVLFRHLLGGEALPALLAPSAKKRATFCGRGARAKAVRSGTLLLFRLISSFHSATIQGFYAFSTQSPSQKIGANCFAVFAGLTLKTPTYYLFARKSI